MTFIYIFHTGTHKHTHTHAHTHTYIKARFKLLTFDRGMFSVFWEQIQTHSAAD